MRCGVRSANNLVAAVGAALFWASWAQAADETSLRVTLTSDRATYEIQEPIILRLDVTNVSDERVQLVDFQQVSSPGLFSGQVIMLDLADDSGRFEFLSHYCGAVTDYFPGDKTRWLVPGETMDTSFVVNQPCPEGMGLRRRTHFFDQPGRYTIRARYYGLFTGVRTASVTSQTLTIDVKER